MEGYVYTTRYDWLYASRMYRVVHRMHRACAQHVYEVMTNQGDVYDPRTVVYIPM